MEAVLLGDTDNHFLFGEGAVLRSQVIELLGAEWLSAKIVALGLRRPDDLIGTEEEWRVRDLLYALSVSALS